MALTNAQLEIWADEYHTMDVQKKALEAAMKIRREEILMHVPVGETIVGDRRIQHLVSERTTVDTKALKEGAPAVYAMFCKTTSVTSLNVK